MKENFVSIGDLLDQGISVADLATAIEKHGIWTNDRFGRFVRLTEKSDLQEIYKTLEIQNKAELGCYDDPELLNSAMTPYELYGHEESSDFQTHGWLSNSLPNFDDPSVAQLHPKAKQSKAPIEFTKSLMKLFIEITYRSGEKLNLDAMPGIRSDLFEVAFKFDSNLDKSQETFNDYLKGFCKFRPGAKSSNFYRKIFSEYFE